MRGFVLRLLYGVENFYVMPLNFLAKQLLKKELPIRSKALWLVFFGSLIWVGLFSVVLTLVASFWRFM